MQEGPAQVQVGGVSTVKAYFFSTGSGNGAQRQAYSLVIHNAIHLNNMTKVDQFAFYYFALLGNKF